MITDAHEPEPAEIAWELIEQLREALESGNDARLSIPSDPQRLAETAAILGRLVVAAAALATIEDDADSVAVDGFLELLRETSSSLAPPRAALSPEDQRVSMHYGEEGPVAIAYEWLEVIADHDYATAWDLMDKNLRLCRSQAWLWNNRDTLGDEDLDSRASLLVQPGSESPLWEQFAHTELGQLHGTWAHHFAAMSAGTLGAASATRIVGPNLEVVVLVDLDSTQPVVYDKPTLITDALVFLVRHTLRGWRVAGYEDRPPDPGWPPQFSHDEPGR